MVRDSEGASGADRAGVAVFVGRERELEVLDAALGDAAAGRGRLFLLTGEPGIGKSRLADVVAELANDRGFGVVWGRCWEAGGAPAYWPWVQSLRAYVQSLSAVELSAELGVAAQWVAQIVADIADVLPDVDAAPVLEPEAGRFRLFDAVATFLRNAGVRRPLMVVLDDLHAADTPSLMLLQFVAQEVAAARVFLLGAYRNVELGRDNPLTFALAELSRQRSTRHLTLFGLSEAEVARMIEETTGAEPPLGVVAAVHRETEGNPLFVNEVVRLLSAEGGLERINDLAALRLPISERIREVIGRRVGRLSDECSRILTLASVFGREFSLEALERVSDRPSCDVLDALDEAAEARVVAEVPGSPGRLRFTHALIRDTMYDSIGIGRRLRLHREAGETLESLYQPDADPYLAELAHHFFEATPTGEATKAVDYAERAGRRALVLLAYEEAVRLFRMALAALEVAKLPDERLRCRLLLALGDALNRAGDHRAAKEQLLQAADLARRHGMAEELGQAALAYGGRFMFARGATDALMISLLEDARAALTDSAGPLRARVLARLAAAMRDQFDVGPRDVLSGEAVELARRLNDPATVAYTLSARWTALIGPDDPLGQLAITEELMTFARMAHDKEREVEGHTRRAMLFMELGRVEECRAAVEAMGRLADDLRQPPQHWLADAAKATLALLEGRLGDANMLIESAFRFGRRSYPYDAAAIANVQRFFLRCENGRLADLEPELRRATEDDPSRPLYRCVLAALFAELGDYERARVTFETLAATNFATIAVNNDFLLSLSLLAEVVRFLGDTDRASILYERLLPYRALLADTFEASPGAIDRYLGLAAIAAGRIDDAELHLRDALELNSRIGALPWLAKTQRDLALLLLARGDPASAVDLFTTALSTAERVGMTVTAARVRDELRRFGGGAPEPAEPALTIVASPAVFRREGDYWLLKYEGTEVRLRDAKGLHHLCRLLRDPGKEFHALDLIALEEGTVPTRPVTRAAPGDELSGTGLSDVGPVLDEQAKSSYRARLRDLREELNEASEWADAARASRVREEIDFLTDELAAAVGLGGRDRKLGSASERARINVTRAIRSALGRIREHSSSLADHLDVTIHTGTFCSYSPDPRSPVSWRS